MTETRIMPEKNWTKTEPTENEYYYYRGVEPDNRIKFGFITGHKYYHVEGRVYIIEDLRGWWAKATTPPFDGEDGK